MNFLSFLARRRPADLQLALRKDNVGLSTRAVSEAQKLGRKINEAVSNRRAIVDSDTRIDPNFGMPAANWDSEANDHVKSYRLLATLQRSELELLRFRSQNFSGNSLITLRPAIPGTSGADDVPADFEAQWSDETRDRTIPHWNAVTRNVPANFVLNCPNILGEVGWWYNGQIVNIDAVHYQERMSLIFRSGVLTGIKNPRIMEIGGGYGALAHGLLSAVRPSQYVICDLPESLLFSGIYLRTASKAPVRLASTSEGIEPRSTGEVCLLPNYLAETLIPGQKFDLVINTLSMSEMSGYQVTTYGRLISDAIRDSGSFFEQNIDNRHAGLIDCREFLAPLFKRQIPINSGGMPIVRGEPVLWSNSI